MKVLVQIGAAVLLIVPCLRASVFVVTSTGDSGPGTLRDAMTLSNASVGHDTIAFSVTDSFAIVRPLSQLPLLTDRAGVTIDGFSQPGSGAGTAPPFTLFPRVVLDGSMAGPSCGIMISSSHNVVRGLSIVGFERDGIRIQATAEGASSNVVIANCIGVEPTQWTTRGNGRDTSALWGGVSVASTSMLPVVTSAFDNLISSNLISGNVACGVVLSGGKPTEVYATTVEANLIGTDIGGSRPAPNGGAGVLIADGSNANHVRDNTISGNGSDGIAIVGRVEPPMLRWVSRDNVIAENRIGAASNGVDPLPNRGNGVNIGGLHGHWQVGHASKNRIRLNVIAHNERNGVAVWENPITGDNADSNTITWNQIVGNGLLGIDLGDDGPTPTDCLDVDEGANGLLNVPWIDSAIVVAPGRAEVHGSVNVSGQPWAYMVEIYAARSDGECCGEGYALLAAAVPTDETMWCARIDGITVGDTLTATLTDDGGNTSEFSRNVVVTLATPSRVSPGLTDAGPDIEVHYSSDGVPERFDVRLPRRSHARVLLWDLLGRKVISLFDGTLEEGVTRLVPPALPGGSYALELATENGRTIRRITYQ